ncbi:unnamed protein product [Gadus morhua 'NCC']
MKPPPKWTAATAPHPLAAPPPQSRSTHASSPPPPVETTVCHEPVHVLPGKLEISSAPSSARPAPSPAPQPRPLKVIQHLPSLLHNERVFIHYSNLDLCPCGEL